MKMNKWNSQIRQTTDLVHSWTQRVFPWSIPRGQGRKHAPRSSSGPVRDQCKPLQTLFLDPNSPSRCTPPLPLARKSVSTQGPRYCVSGVLTTGSMAPILECCVLVRMPTTPFYWAHPSDSITFPEATTLALVNTCELRGHDPSPHRCLKHHYMLSSSILFHHRLACHRLALLYQPRVQDAGEVEWSYGWATSFHLEKKTYLLLGVNKNTESIDITAYPVLQLQIQGDSSNHTHTQ